MYVDGYGSGVDLVRQMQHVGDLQNAWMMFNRAKHVEGWTTMVCHIHNPIYYKMMTIAICDMQLKTWKPNVFYGQNSH